MNARRLVLAILCTMTGALVSSAAPALAATGNAYRSQFTRPETGERPFFPSVLAFNASGDVFVFDAEHKVLDEFNSSGSGAPLVEFTGDETPAEGFYTEGIAVNASGDVFAAAGERKVVYEFEPDGKLLREINGGKTTAESFYPTGVAVNSTTGDLYVADYEHGIVDEFEPAAFEASPTGRPIKEFAVSEPGDVAVDTSSEDLYVISAAVVKEFEPDGTLLRTINGSETPQGSFSSYVPALAVAPSGEAYIPNGEYGVVDRFSSAGTYESQFDGSATPQGSFTYAFGLAVNASEEVYVSDGYNHVVDEFSKPVPVPVVTTGSATEVLQTTATLTGSIESSGGLEAGCEFRYSGPSGSATAPCEPAGPFSGLNEVQAKISGLTGKTAYTYRLLGTTSEGSTPGEEQTFATLGKVVSPPTVSIEAVTPIAQNSATFNGKVNPHEAATTYHFEYSNDGVNWTSLNDESAGDGSSEVSVTQAVAGLTGHTTYYVRLVAENSCEHGVTGCGANTSTVETSTTLAGPPKVSGTGATDITAGEATLHATIYPENQPSTTYRFEYGPTIAYGTTVPVGEGHVGSRPSQVSQAIAGLAPGTTYHFRVVASNGVGSPKETADQTFTTYSSTGTSSGCPNEQVRGESDMNPETGVPFSLVLPECRAFEMVSPALKNGAPLTSAANQALGSGSIVSRVGSEGSTVLINSTGIWPGGEQPANNDLLASQAIEAVRYRVTRGKSGWGFMPEVPSASELSEYDSFIVPEEADISPNGIWQGFGFSPTEQKIDIREAPNDPNLYLLEPDGTLAEIGPSAPLSSRLSATSEGEGEVQPAGASTDQSHVLFSAYAFRWPFDQSEIYPTRNGRGYKIGSLYEYIGTGHSGEGSDVPTLVGVDNTGTLVSRCGTEAGGGENTISSEAVTPPSRDISAGGATVFFTALPEGLACDESSSTGAGTGPAVKQLLARVGEPGTGTAVGSAVTVNVAGSTECAISASDSCNVTKPVTYQGASTDGSKVFFTSEQPLAGGTDPTNNLYECGLPGDAGAPLIRMTPVNPCPDLVRVSVPISSGSAEVQSVVAVSADGSHVYFIAKGVLSGENAEHNGPTSGQDNLYVWEREHTTFIATLPSAPKEAQATPDGDSLVFTSSGDLTPDDTSTVSQVFLYEAQHEALVRVSKGENGFNDNGNTTTDPATITADNRRSISEDGSTVVFQSSQALTPQVHGGTRNVYLWRGGNVYLISDGTPAGEKSGRAFAGLVGIDASGQNVFFTTAAQLVGQDKDELSDLYDARVDGGFPAPKVDECVGEACQGALPSSLGPVTPGSLSPSGQGNLAPPSAKSSSPPPPKPLTRAQKLVKALKACTRDKPKKKRAQCEAAARKRYGADKHKPKKRKAGKRTPKGAK